MKSKIFFLCNFFDENDYLNTTSRLIHDYDIVIIRAEIVAISQIWIKQKYKYIGIHSY